jgi:exosortase/archaeosortase family protein
LNSEFSFVIISFNEEQHLPGLLASIKDLDAAVFLLDSGSTDATLSIAEQHGITVLTHAFENHPRQWDYALQNFDIKTSWVICLDSDHTVTPELKKRLQEFTDTDFKDINGIYFNRKNFFKGSWIKHGGYSPFYLLKMFRYGVGYSDLNENMDHRFIVPGKTIIWKDGYILEENLKENSISFWIAKHNRYSDLVAQEEVERMLQMRSQTLQPNFWGSPDERTAWLKQLWWKLPRYARPMLYLIYRMFFQLGILDGRTGVIFHFLQGFWFRLVVDIKIDEILRIRGYIKETAGQNNNPIRFVVKFVALFAFLYYFDIFFFGLTTPGNRYVPFLADHLDYISWLRTGLLKSSAGILNMLGYTAITNEYELLVAGHGVLKIVYSCLGSGLISFFAAFVLAYPRKLKPKLWFLFTGIIGIEVLNILRFVLLAIFWDKREKHIIDHHAIFNILLYLIIAITLYFWVRHDDDPRTENTANRPLFVQ